MSDTTITLDLAGDHPAQNAAHIFLRARTGEPGPMSPDALAKRVNEVAVEPSNIRSYTQGFDSDHGFVRGLANAKYGGDCGQVTVKELEAYLREFGMEIASLLLVPLSDEEKADAGI